MVNYKNSVIYKLCCKDANVTDIYVGSTTNTYRRKSEHKRKCHNNNAVCFMFPVYQCIRNNGGFDNWDFVVIEKYPCDDKQELHTRERYYIEKLKATLNKRIPTRTIKEYIADNIDEIRTKSRKYGKIYNVVNRERRNKYGKQWYNENKEQILYRRRQNSYIDGNCPVCNKTMKKKGILRHCRRRHKPDFTKIE